MNEPHILVRISALFAAFLMATLAAGSQLGLAEYYTTQADAVQGAQQATRAALRTVCPAMPASRG